MDIPTPRRLPYIWDYDLDEAQFYSILHGQQTIGRLDQDWAAVRLLEYAPYADIVRLLGFASLRQGWGRWRLRLKSARRRRGLDFLTDWLNQREDSTND